MINAKTEFIKAVQKKDIKCAVILYKGAKSLLPVGYSLEMFVDFVKLLDFKYDNGYGEQLLFGTIWFKNNSWLERDEYDGSESWRLKQIPEIPKELKILHKKQAVNKKTR